MSDPKGLSQERIEHQQFRNGITSVLTKLSAAEKKSQDKIYYRFKAPNSEFLDNKKRAIGQPNHRYMREYFAFIERQKPYEFYSSRDLADLNPADYKSIRWGTLRPQTPISSDLSAVTEDRKQILLSMSTEVQAITARFAQGKVAPELPPNWPLEPWDRTGNVAQPTTQAAGGSTSGTKASTSSTSTASESEDEPPKKKLKTGSGQYTPGEQIQVKVLKVKRIVGKTPTSEASTSGSQSSPAVTSTATQPTTTTTSGAQDPKKSIDLPTTQAAGGSTSRAKPSTSSTSTASESEDEPLEKKQKTDSVSSETSMSGTQSKPAVTSTAIHPTTTTTTSKSDPKKSIDLPEEKDKPCDDSNKGN